MTNEEIGKRITIAREKIGLTKKELADRIDVSPSTITRYETGAFDRLKIAIIESIGHATGVNPLWLSGRSEQMEDTYGIPPYANIHPIATRRFPLFDGIACGEPRLIPEGIECYIDATIEVKADYVLKCHGDSMEGARIHDGDLVFIRSQPTVENGEIAAVIMGDSATLKRVFWYAGKTLLVLRAENPKYADIEISGCDLETVRILGKAVAFQSDVR